MPRLTERPETHRHTETRCCCPACVGLTCLERPRFFAGQLLTETELNSEQGYVLAKSRLHNRYLHGWGVVCGLEVSCDDCAGWVKVSPGYAIDPCGNDIVACESTSFDFIKSIRECRRKDPARPDCDPLVVGAPQGCKDIEEHWCLTITYEERESRPKTALRWQRASARAGGECACGGGCGGGCGCKGGCGCGSSSSSGGSARNGHANGKSRTAPACGCGCSSGTTAVSAGVDVCEPTRIVESFKLGTVREDDACCPDPRDRLEGTLFASIRDCFVKTRAFVEGRMPKRAWAVVEQTMGGGGGPAAAVATYEAVCYLHQAIYDLYAGNAKNVRCAAFDVLKKVQLPGAPSNDADVANAAYDKTYADQARPTLQALVALLVQYIIDCICEHLLPPCAPDPCDGRLILACVTVRGDRIINICNFSCRRFAGSFPAWNHWLSIVPVVPLLRSFIEKLCCRDWISANSPVRNTLFESLDRLDPTGALREALVARDFATPRAQLSRLAALQETLGAAGLGALFAPERVNLALFVGRPLGETTKSLEARGVTIEPRAVASDSDIPAGERFAAPFTAERGSRLIAYTTADRIVGFTRADEAEAGAAGPAGAGRNKRAGGEQPASARELASLRKELAALRAEVAELRHR